MAQLFPKNFDVAVLPQSEQRAITHLLQGLDDTWIVLPNIPITVDGADREIDCVLVSIDHGVYVAEIKGGVVNIKEGVWHSYENKIKDPADQALKAKHALIQRLRRSRANLKNLFIQHVVLLPDIVEFPADGAGPGCPREIVLTKTELLNPVPVFAALRQHNQPVSSEQIKALLQALRPDVKEIEVNGNYFEGVSQRLNMSTHSQLSPLLPLDENRHLYVYGSAGTGKTYLATSWAQRALHRGERTLVVCYNRFLGSEIQQRMTEYTQTNNIDTPFYAGSFHAVVNMLLPGEPLVAPNPAPQEWWDSAHAQAIIDNAGKLKQLFDTIIVDEGQDFFPLWFTALETLRASGDDSRMFITADQRQAIYAEPWTPPAHYARVPLHNNLRNSRTIAKLISGLGGAQAPTLAPQGPKVEIVRVGGAKERRKAVGKAIKKVHEELQVPLSQILVLAPHRVDVEDLTSEPTEGYALTTWFDRTEDSVVCGTIQGTKGLERAAVILTCMDDTLEEALVYIGASRAVTSLTIIGRESFLASLNPPATTPAPET